MLSPGIINPIEEGGRASGALLAIGLEPEGVRVCLLENVGGSYRLIGWVGLQQDPGLDLAQQVTHACQRLSQRLGRTLWSATENMPLLESDDAIRHPPLSHVALGMMARPRLRLWLAGLSQTVGLAPLTQVLLSSPVRVVGQSVLNTGLQSGRLATALANTQPDGLVLVGGYDDAAPPAQQNLLLLGKTVGQAVARLAPGQRPAIFVAGNRQVATELEAWLKVGEGPVGVEMLPNLQPSAGVVRSAELMQALQQHYWRVAQRLPGFAQLSHWVTPPGQLTSLATSFAQLTQAWCAYQQLPELHALYCTAEWRLHVWARQGQAGVRQCFVEPQALPTLLRDWPPIQLLSGGWPRGLAENVLPLRLRWWDPSGLAPIVAPIGQVAPLALLQVLEQDIFTERLHNG